MTYKGIQDASAQNETAIILMEYTMRKRLAEMGYRFDPGKLSVFKAECFNIIGVKIQELNEEESKENSKPRGRN